MNWDDEDFDVPVPAAAAALGAGPITANSAADWEDEDAGLHEEAPAAEPAKPVVMKAKHLKKAARAEAAAKERQHDDIISRAEAAYGGPLDDPAEERKRLERIQVAADLELAADTFGLGDEETEAAAAAAAAAGGDDIAGTLAKLPIAVSSSHEEIAEAMMKQAYAGRSRLNGLKFVKALVQAAKEHLSVDDMADIVAMLNSAKNAKLQANKPKGKKGKKGKAKPRAFARVETDDQLIDEGSAATRSADAGLYDDFM